MRPEPEATRGEAGQSTERATGFGAVERSAPYHHRELLGKLSRAAWETVCDIMDEAVGESDFRAGMVAPSMSRAAGR